jgi:hypothetical protein
LIAWRLLSGEYRNDGSSEKSKFGKKFSYLYDFIFCWLKNVKWDKLCAKSIRNGHTNRTNTNVMDPNTLVMIFTEAFTRKVSTTVNYARNISSAEFYKVVNRFFWENELIPLFDTLLSSLQNANLKIRKYQFKPLKNAVHLSCKATSIVMNGEITIFSALNLTFH